MHWTAIKLEHTRNFYSKSCTMIAKFSCNFTKCYVSIIVQEMVNILADFSWYMANSAGIPPSLTRITATAYLPWQLSRSCLTTNPSPILGVHRRWYSWYPRTNELIHLHRYNIINSDIINSICLSMSSSFTCNLRWDKILLWLLCIVKLLCTYLSIKVKPTTWLVTALCRFSV